tara:strand:- start:9765 stop:11576 length:1812 start_codon:yes stop_codon:yes gene_type:complete
MLTKLPFTIDAIHQAYRQQASPEQVIQESLNRLTHIADEGIYLYLATPSQLATAIAELGPFDPELKPLWGIPFAVKDNIDVATMPTTAACPEFSYIPEEDACVVSLLKQAGAIVIGKTNLDQFATGLVGVRTPYPAPKNAIDANLVPGGSSSGSAVAVAHGQVCFSLGTDTAGSGRIPAALNNIVGLKPTLGSISSRGVIPACRSIETVSIFALTVSDASTVYDCSRSYDHQDPFSKPYRGMSKHNVPAQFTMAIPDANSLIIDERAQKEAYQQAISDWQQQGAKIVEINFQPFYDVAKLLYEGPWVAERLAAIEPFLAKHPNALHSTTHQIIESARNFSAADTFNAYYQLQVLRKEIAIILESIDVLCVPSMPGFVSTQAIQLDPIGPNSRLGTYTNFVNLLDLCAISVPGQTRVDGYPSSITLIAQSACDAFIHSLAADYHRQQAIYLGATKHSLTSYSSNDSGQLSDMLKHDEMAIAVVGAHMADLPLNYQLTEKGGRFLLSTSTAPVYRLYQLDDNKPLRPGLIRDKDGQSIKLEVWALPKHKVADLIEQIPSPLGIGTIVLSDQQQVKGFLCEPHGLTESRDISQFGGWRTFCQSEGV